MKILQLKDIKSTNSYAKQFLSALPEEPLLIVAQQQSGGKGQNGRIFSSPRGGLYFTILFQPLLETACLPLITLATGVACAKCLGAETGLQVSLKWPNDIYVQGKKLGGILCESGTVTNNPWVIIGVGLNINTIPEDHPVELQSIVTTLREHTGSKCNLNNLLDKISDQIFSDIQMLSTQSHIILEQWQGYDYLFQRPVEYVTDSKVLRGIGDGITKSGCYQLRDAQGTFHQIVGGQLRPL